jgi:hypothetical protein
MKPTRRGRPCGVDPAALHMEVFVVAAKADVVKEKVAVAVKEKAAVDVNLAAQDDTQATAQSRRYASTAWKPVTWPLSATNHVVSAVSPVTW